MNNHLKDMGNPEKISRNYKIYKRINKPKFFSSGKNKLKTP
jgi:hypothetical protein